MVAGWPAFSGEPGHAARFHRALASDAAGRPRRPRWGGDRANAENPQARYEDAAEITRDLAQCRALRRVRAGVAGHRAICPIL
jgi:hypothetical protein